MTNPTREHPPTASPFSPPTLHPPIGESAPTTRHSVIRRFAERFALVAFGLYHLPLFVNNYPSLGGGGFAEDGLSVRWGHVFTVPGMWVARHVLGVSGPMPSGSQGDNGDVAEEFGRLLLGVVIAVVAALWWTAADRRKPRGQWVGPALRVLLRYSIALGLASYAIAKILPMQFPALSTTTLETRLGDLSPMTLLWSFMEYSRAYALFGGLAELAVVLLLCFRRTTTLGALICITVMTNVALLNLAYGVPVKLYAVMIVVSATVLVVYDLPRLWAVFDGQRAVAAARDVPLFGDRLPDAMRWTIKAVLVGSVVVSCFLAMVPATRPPTARAALDGTWILTSFTGGPQWRRLAIDRNAVAIRLDTDSLLRCGGTIAEGARTLTLRCAAGRTGQLGWTRSGDTLQLSGTFAGASINATARYFDRGQYRLLRSRFRLISD